MSIPFLDGEHLARVQAELFRGTNAEFERFAEGGLLPVEFLLDHSRESLRIMDHYERRLETNDPREVVHFTLVLDNDLPFDCYTRIEEKFIRVVQSVWGMSRGHCIAEASLGSLPDDKLGVIGRYSSTEELQHVSELREGLKKNPDGSFPVQDTVQLMILLRMALREFATVSLAFPSLGIGFSSQFDLKLLVWLRDPEARGALESAASQDGLYLRSLT